MVESETDCNETVTVPTEEADTLDDVATMLAPNELLVPPAVSEADSADCSVLEARYETVLVATMTEDAESVMLP